MTVLSQRENTNALSPRSKTAGEVRDALLERREIAMLDVREEAFHAEGHPLFAANLPLSRIELDAYARLPRRSVPIVLFDHGEGLALLASKRLISLGYTDVSLLEGGLEGWRDAGYEVFRDVNSASKAFGELVEALLRTPSLSAQQVKELIESKADVVIVDARRFDEFQTMSIPTAVSAPGGELVYRLRGLEERPTTRVIVNCGGRTRSIIGAQSLINAGLPNPIAALRNGTIGWKLAHQQLDHGASRRAPKPDKRTSERAAIAARQLADAVGVRRILLDELHRLRVDCEVTTYLFDVRTPEEYAAGHLPTSCNAPGGQLVQETDMFAPVRGAHLVLFDDDGTRANMTASWLAQMAWKVHVVDGIKNEDLWSVDRLENAPDLPPIPEGSQIGASALHRWIQQDNSNSSRIVVLDFSRSREYRKGHIPGSWFALQSRIDEALLATEHSHAYVVTAREEAAAYLAFRDLRSATEKPVYLLAGTPTTWEASGYTLASVDAKFASQPVDYYRRPYEGIDASPESMQAYLDWEYGLIEQLDRDGTHGFRVFCPA